MDLLAAAVVADIGSGEIGQYIGNGVSVLIASIAIIVALIQRKTRTPADDNERIRIGNEFLSGLLQEAREERKELQNSLTKVEAANRDLELDKKALTKSKEELEDSVKNLQALLARKDARILELENRMEALANKLRRGEVITFADIFGPQAPDIDINIDADHNLVS